MDIRSFQKRIEEIYFQKDSARGPSATFCWFAEEVGELARSLRKGSPEEQREEFADVIAWLATLASLHGIDLEDAAITRYGTGCPHCDALPCRCKEPR
ncbi:MAG: MazG nucleotide pyrophosphohydrolase domain-containing protein [Planctomycetota bacterium]